MLTKTMVKVGNSYAIVLDRTLMDLAGLSPDVPVNIQVNGQSLTITSASAPISVDQAIDEVFSTHAEALRRLSR
ncbi:MAG TPA: AbrB/MazE/SpoVT family DNA-binding domain-containing protein [Holophaga sp.]|nr:AbrB/MazE/SpoVT family DNA-binding domain-containing protein [Holophaga sp.]